MKNTKWFLLIIAIILCATNLIGVIVAMCSEEVTRFDMITSQLNSFLLSGIVLIDSIAFYKLSDKIEDEDDEE